VTVSSMIVIQTSGQWSIAIRVHIHEMVTTTIHDNEGNEIWKYLEKYAVLCSFEVNSMSIHTKYCGRLIYNRHTDKWSMEVCH
jgi:hypothetical protein